MLEFLLAPFSLDIGIDLGTANTLVYVRGKGVIIREPSVVAIHRKTDTVLAVGSEAKKMVGKTPSNISSIRPLREGVVSDFEATERMLKYFLRKVHQIPSKFPRVPRPKVVIGIPSGVTDVERRAVRDAALQSGAREAYLIEEPLGAALGADLPVEEPEGSLIVDVGGGTTEIAIISLGGIVVGKSLRVAGDRLNEAIVDYAREQHNLLLGDQSAEKVKMQIGNAFPVDNGEDEFSGAVMRGRDLVTGLPKEITLSRSGAREALSVPLVTIVGAVRDVIEAAPPELLSDVLQKGITLVGGGSLLAGLDKYLAREASVPVRTVEDPASCVARGCGKLLENSRLLKQIAVE
ncbi:MAG: rod shape-determining protein [Patescibacteria group bacterium]